MTTQPGAAAEEESVIDDPRRRRAILIAVCIALMAVIASVTGLNVAQPELAVEFDASQSTVLWFINLYTISLAAFLLPFGALGDRLGRKPVLLVGLALFGAANVAAGVAGSSEVMLVARLAAGIGAAMIMPVTLAVITSTFPPEERSKGIGAWTAVAGGGGILGMYLSALLVDVASWRWLFVLPVALVLVAVVVIVRAVPDSREHTEHRFDVVGSILSVLAVVGLIYALHEGPVHGWSEPTTVLGLVGASLPRSPSSAGSDVSRRRCSTSACSADVDCPADRSPCSWSSACRPASSWCSSRSCRPSSAGRRCGPRWR